jgi:hypothetical protein
MVLRVFSGCGMLSAGDDTKPGCRPVSKRVTWAAEEELVRSCHLDLQQAEELTSKVISAAQLALQERDHQCEIRCYGGGDKFKRG